MTDTLLMYTVQLRKQRIFALHTMTSLNRPLAQLLSAHAIVAGGLGFISRFGHIVNQYAQRLVNLGFDVMRRFVAVASRLSD